MVNTTQNYRTIQTLLKSVEKNASTVDATSVTGTTITDGVATMTGGAVSGVTTLTTTGTVDLQNAVFKLPNLPTSDPATGDGAIWSNAGVLTLST